MHKEIKALHEECLKFYKRQSSLIESLKNLKEDLKKFKETATTREQYSQLD
jgi:hypothetical protein